MRDAGEGRVVEEDSDGGTESDGETGPDGTRPEESTEPYAKPLPNVARELYARPFWEAAAEERLVVQYCPDCDAHQYFPRPWCADCAGETEWVEVSGQGRVYSYTVVRRAISNPAMADDVPYVTAYVELAEGPRVMTTVVDCDVTAVERGMAVEAAFDHVTEDVTLVRFRPS